MQRPLGRGLVLLVLGSIQGGLGEGRARARDAICSGVSTAEGVAGAEVRLGYVALRLDAQAPVAVLLAPGKRGVPQGTG